MYCIKQIAATANMRSQSEGTLNAEMLVYGVVIHQRPPSIAFRAALCTDLILSVNSSDRTSPITGRRRKMVPCKTARFRRFL
jgi:hypothetical protein